MQAKLFQSAPGTWQGTLGQDSPAGSSRELWTSWMWTFSGAQVWWKQKTKDSVQLQGKEREVRAVALGDSWTRTSPRRSGPRLGTHLLGKPRTGTVTTWQPCAIRGSAYCDPQWCQATAMCHCRADSHSLSHPEARAGPSPDLQLPPGCWGTTAGVLQLDGLEGPFQHQLFSDSMREALHKENGVLCSCLRKANNKTKRRIPTNRTGRIEGKTKERKGHNEK